MAAEKSAAIVLKVTEFSETSCVATLYTREFGKVTGLAKGARRKNSPFEAALDVLSLVRLVFLRKTPPALDLFTEARLERRFRAGAVSLERLYAAYHVIELLLVLTEGGEAQPELFDQAAATVIGLDSDPAEPFQWLTRFELDLLRLLGHQPMLDGCVSCGRAVPPEATRFYFCSVSGGIVCSQCRLGKIGVLTLSRAALDWLSDPSGSASSLARKTRNEIRQTLNHFENTLAGFRLPAQEFLK